MEILEAGPRDPRGGKDANYRPARRLASLPWSDAMVRVPSTFDRRRAVDLPAPAVWHPGLFIAATRLNGGGFARRAQDAHQERARKARAGCGWAW
jgi:hypothetical protein